MTAARLEEMRLDAEELKSLLSTATRQKVKDVLSLDLRKIETDIIRLQEQISKESVPSTPSSAPVSVAAGGRCYDVKIMNYAWDQSDKFVKVFVTMKNVHTLPSENVSCDFTDRSMELHINGLENRNHHLPILNLLEEINVEKSYWKVKTDNVIVYMVKSKTGQNWSHLTGVEKKVTEKKAPKYEPSATEDPSSSIMGLLKQMYEDGDDDMKRNIAKAWASNQEKKTTLDGIPGMPDMPSF